MGTSRASSNAKSVFKSIIEQLEILFKINKEEEEYKKAESFESKLFYISKNCLIQEKLVILLDSIDQLSVCDYKLGWMFYKLPKNVKIIYSILKENELVLTKLKANLKSENFIELKLMKNSDAKRILHSYLERSNRKLTEIQKDSINKMIDESLNMCPLQIKLIFDIVSKWKSSFNVPDEFKSCKTNIDFIKYIFKIIERDVLENEVFFKRCLFYLTLFENRGISENELEDILSIDDVVLDSIFVKYHPPARRIPMALWYRLKYELSDYITNKVTDDVSVVSW